MTACLPDAADRALDVTLVDTARSGAPAVHVTVSVFPAGDVAAPATVEGITNSSGRVVFAHSRLPAGDYHVLLGSPEGIDWNGNPVSDGRWFAGTPGGVSADRGDAQTVTVSDEAPTKLVVASAVPRGGIMGVLSGPEDLTGYTVSLYAVPSDRVVATTQTDAQGRYGFSGVPAPNYKVGFTKPGWARFWALRGSGDALSLADASTFSADRDGTYLLYPRIPKKASTITGTVLPDGVNAKGGVFVGAHLADTGALAQATRTAADGSFELTGLGKAEYHLSIVDPEAGADGGMVLGAGLVPMAEFDVARGSAFSLQEGGTLSVGTVTLTVGADCAAVQESSEELVEADLAYADLHNCDLSTADFTLTNLLGANLSGANLSHAFIPSHDVISVMADAVLVNANLSHAQNSLAFGPSGMDGADLRGADLSHAQLLVVALVHSNLTGANLSHANLTGSSLSGANVSGADLSSPTIQRTAATSLSWSVPPTIPEGYRLVESHLVGPGTVLDSIDLSGVDLSGMDLTGVGFFDLNLTGADLSYIDLSPTEWSFVDLSGADLSGATLSPSSSYMVVTSASTLLPAGWGVFSGRFVPI